MKNSILSFVFTAALMLSASSSYAIIGGKVVTSDDPIAHSTVGLLLQTPQGMAICTGSLISPTQVLSAGHCAVGASQIYVIFDTNVDRGSQNVGAVRRVINRNVAPSFIAASLGVGDGSDHSDVSILTFVGGVPQGYYPAKLMTRELASQVLKEDARITLAGYGAIDYHASEGSGTLRKISTKIDKFYASGRSVKVGTSSNGACHGDSGGPAIINVNGQNYVFAVTSRSTAVGNDGSCSGRAIYSLVF